MFVLGIDPGLSATGYGLVESSSPPKAVLAGVMTTDTAAPAEERLFELHRGLRRLMAETETDVVALETLFTNRNLHTAIAVGRASGIAMLAAAQEGLPVFEYVPTAVKSAVTGDGSANKAQVQAMVARLLQLRDAPKPADAADALAIALCHLQASGLRAGA